MLVGEGRLETKGFLFLFVHLSILKIDEKRTTKQKGPKLLNG